MPGGVATPTIANNPVAFSYVSNGVQFALNMPFVPTMVQFYGGTNSWAWVRGFGFGDATITTPTSANGRSNTACVLDILDGSGIASTNVATTTAVIGLLIGTNTFVNPGSGLNYYGQIYR